MVCIILNHITFAVTKLLIFLAHIQNIHISLFLMPCHAEELGVEEEFEESALPFSYKGHCEGMALGLPDLPVKCKVSG